MLAIGGLQKSITAIAACGMALGVHSSDIMGTHTTRVAPEEEEREAARQRGVARRASERGGVATVNDATRGLLREPLREPGASNYAFRALAENVRDYAIFLLNPQGIITFWGEGAHLMKGWSADEAEGAHLRLLYPARGSEDGTAEEHLTAAAEHGEYAGEGYRVRKDGSTIWTGVTLTALRDDNGRLLGFAKVSRDLSVRRAADAVAEAARLAAEAANRAKSSFLATMSHEIRTPLNAILGYLELMELEVDGPLTTGQRMFLDRARASDRQLMELVDDVLDLSRIEADRVVVDNSVRRLESIITYAVALVEPNAAAKHLTIVNRAIGQGPGIHYRGDEARARQIVANLLTNSVKFTDAGGRVTISTGLANELPADAARTSNGPWAFVRVEDTGAGIPAERLAAVFEPFVQADMSHTRRHGGRGLGLAISRGLARLMGGDVTGASTPGAGSTFVLWLRSAPAPVRAATPGGATGPDAAQSASVVAAPPALRGALGVVAAAALGDVRRVLHAHVARLRSDPLTPSARRMRERVLEDHIGTFIADLAQSLAALDVRSGGDPALLSDGLAVQHEVAERHGRQRARFGWRAEEIRREYEILSEELAAAVQRRTEGTRTADIDQTIDALHVFVAEAERVSLAAFADATAAASSGG
jgi:PAS domain S-box-containing protein